MEYREAFWVVVGTAAPLIALAVIVAIGPVLGRVPRGSSLRGEAKRDIRVRLAAYLLGLSFVLNDILFIFALDSLANEKNFLPPTSVVSLEITSMTFLVLGSTYAIFAASEQERTRVEADQVREPSTLSQERKRPATDKRRRRRK